MNIQQYDDNFLFQSDQEELELVKIIKSVKCDLLEYGNKKSMMEFYFCSCDPDQKDPICRECALKCHANHSLSLPYKGENICQCGLKNHRITSDLKSDNFYVSTCYFHEISTFSNINLFYETEELKNICIFCKNFCYTSSKKKDIQFKRSYDSEVPPCDCENEEHIDIKYIFKCMNRLFDKKANNLESLSPTHMMNVIFRSERLLKNVYSSFIFYINKLKESILQADFELDPRMNYSSFYWSLQNFSSIAFKAQYLLYFSTEAQNYFTYQLAIEILDKKFNYSNNNIWLFKSFYFNCFNKITLGSALCNVARYSIDDFENFSPLQRLVITSNIKSNTKFLATYIEDPKHNIIDHILSNLTLFNHSRINYFKNGLNLIFILSSTLKKFAKLYLFTSEQKLKYCIILDELFHNLIDSNKNSPKDNEINKGIFTNYKEFKNNFVLMKVQETKNKEMLILINMMKTLIYFALSYNDQTVLNGLYDIKTLENKFFHNKNETGKYITKNCINVLNYIKNDMDSEDNLVKKILFYSNQLLSLSLINPDVYYLGLKRALNDNIPIYLSLLKSTLSSEDIEFLNYANYISESLESKYNDYFSFRFNIKMLNAYTKKLILEFFKYAKSMDFVSVNPTTEHLSNYFTKKSSTGKYKTRELKNLRRRSKYANKNIQNTLDIDLVRCRLLLLKTNLISSVIKILYINSYYLDSSINNEYDESTTDLVLRCLYFYIFDHADNSILILSSDILKCLSSTSVDHIDKILEVIYCCVQTIGKHKYELPYSYKLIPCILAIFLKTLVNNFFNF